MPAIIAIHSSLPGPSAPLVEGYRAGEFITFLESLKKLSGTSEMKVLTSTHPSPDDRIRTIRPLVPADRGTLLAERWEQWTK